MSKKRESWYFRLPWHIRPPELTELGLELRQLPSPGPRQIATTTVTLMDTADERLRRAAVNLAQRSDGEHAQWFIWSDEWQPWLPPKPDQPVSAEAELSDEVADMTRAFRSRSPLRPVATATRARAHYLIVNDNQDSVASVTSDRIVVRRNGVTVTRCRHMAIDVTQLTKDQREYIRSSFESSGGFQTDSLPALVEQATHSGRDHALPGKTPAGGSLDAFVGWLLARREYKIVIADLAVRTGQLSDMMTLNVALSGLRDDMGVLGDLLRPQWRDEQLRRLDKLRSQSDLYMLGSETYLDLLDALEGATRTPPLAIDGATPARPLFADRLDRDRLALIDHMDALVRAERAQDENAAGELSGKWTQMLLAGGHALQLAEAAGVLFERRKRIVKVLGKLVAALSAAQPPEDAPTRDEINQLSPEQAYAAGRALERALQANQTQREDLVEHWDTWRMKLLALSFAADGEGKRR